MAVKLLQSLVQRGVFGTRVTGLDSKARGLALPATWSDMSHPNHSDYRPNVMAEPLTAVSAVKGAGRSQGSTGAARISFAINAKRAVLSGWPVSSVAAGKAVTGSGWRAQHRNLFDITQPALQAPGCGSRKTVSG